MKRFQIGTLFRSPFGRSLALTLLVFTLLPIVALIALNGYIIKMQLQDRSVNQITTVADLIQQNMSRWITSTNTELSTILANPVVSQNANFILKTETDGSSRVTDVLQKQFAAIKQTQPLADLYLVQPDGTVVVSTNGDSDGKALGIDINQLQQSGHHYWGFGTLPLTGKLTALTWQPITDQRDEIAGFLAAEYDVQTLTPILTSDTVSIGQTGEAYLIDEQYIPLTPLHVTGLAPQPLALDQPVVSALQNQAGSYSGNFTDYQQNPVLGTIQSLKMPLTGWLVVSQQQSEAFYILYTVSRAALAFTVLLGLLALTASLVTTRRLVTPLQTMAQAARAMARGHFNTRVPVMGNDEFSVVARTFNSMARELEESFTALESYNQKLKRRAEQLNIITRIGQHATSFLKIDLLMNTIVAELLQAFDYHAIVLYLLDSDGKTLTARAAAGTSADQIIVRGLQWQIGQGLVGRAATPPYLTEVREFSDISIYLADEFLPETKAQVAIPLVVNADQKLKLLGVLDIQSVNSDAFDANDLDVLQIIADQIEISIHNAYLFQETEEARQTADDANQQKTEFLSNMSHELRTPLNVIIGYSHSILTRPAMYDNEPLPAVYQQAITYIMTNGQHLLSLINDILDLNKIESGRLELDIERVDPLSVLQGVRATALGLIKKEVQLRVDYPPELPFIQADELRLRQILLNLVSNAAKFTEHGFITLNAQVQDERVLFSVADTGPGIPEDVQPVLFTRFKQATAKVARKYGGTGLGLNISRQLAVMHGGDIWFESTPGEGTTFYFTIPLAPADDADISIHDTDPTAEVSKRINMFLSAEQEQQSLARQVVLIDMLSETRMELQNALSKAGYSVVPADDAERGLMIATTLTPDAIVIHVHPEDKVEMQALGKALSQDESLQNTPILTLEDVNPKVSIGWSQQVLTQIQAAFQAQAGKTAA